MDWEELQIVTRRPTEFIDITGKLAESLAASQIKNGFGIVFVTHTTAGLTINENADPDVVKDLIMALDHIAPLSLPFRHGEGNSHAHLRSSLLGVERLIPVRDGRMILGQWQSVYLCEFDGPRTRRVLVRWQGQ